MYVKYLANTRKIGKNLIQFLEQIHMITPIFLPSPLNRGLESLRNLAKMGQLLSAMRLKLLPPAHTLGNALHLMTPMPSASFT